MRDFYKNGPLTGDSSLVGQDSCRWRTALLLILAGLVLGTLLVPVAEWMGL